MVSPHKSDNHDMVRVILLMKMTTNAVVTWSAFSITDENSGNKALKNPALYTIYPFPSAGFFSAFLPEFSSVIEKADHVTTAFVVIIIRRMTLTMS